MPLRLHILSDLHLEWHRSSWQEFLQGLILPEVDVLVLAGDVAGAGQLRGALTSLCAAYPEVVYVAGNHEHYGTSFARVREELGRLQLSNLHHLDNRVVSLHGVRFVGSTLWFPESGTNQWLSSWLSDFSKIEEFVPAVYQENVRARSFLEEVLEPGDVVVSHHLPSEASLVEKYAGHPLNAFFLCPMDDLIVERRPALWVHGHTHASCDHRVGETRVICNPFGYWAHEMNRKFRADLVVELPVQGETP